MNIGIGRLVKKYQHVWRYIVVGLTTVAIDVGLLYLLVQVGVPVYVAATIAFGTALLTNFTLSRVWTFGVRRRTPYQTALYGLLILGNYLFSLLLIGVFLHFNASYIAGKVTAVAITTIWNFLIYRYVIFVPNYGSWRRRLRAFFKL